jgi:SRSO17 transposase
VFAGHFPTASEATMASTESELRFSAYVEGLVGAIGHADRAVPLHDYCLGLLLPGERKSVEPMAAVTAPVRVAAQHPSPSSCLSSW